MPDCRRMKTETMPCPRCNGKGKVTSPESIAAAKRVIRKATGLSLRQFAKRMRISAAFLSDLETGRRHWGERAEKRFTLALADLQKRRAA